MHAPSPSESRAASQQSTSSLLPGISARTLLWPLLLSLLVLGIIGYFTFDVREFWGAVRHASPLLLLAAVGTVAMRIIFGGMRLSFVSQGRLSLSDGLRAQIAWDFFSNVTPSTVGGGPLAAAYIHRDRNMPLGDSTALIVFAVLLDQLWWAISIPFLLVLTLHIDVIPEAMGSVGLWSFMVYFAGLLCWSVFLGYTTLVRPIYLQRLADRVFRLRLLKRFHSRVMKEMLRWRRQAFVLRSQPLRFYLKGLGLTIGNWMGRYLLVVFILWSVFPGLDVFLTFMRSVAILFGALLLPTPGGAGGLEGLYVLFFGSPLIPAALVAPTLLIWRFLGYYIYIVLGVFLSMDQVHRSLRRNEASTQEDEESEESPQVTVSVIER